MLNLIENPKQITRIGLASISSNIYNTISEKLLVSSLAISFAFCPTGSVCLQNSINTKSVSMQYKDNISSNGNGFNASLNSLTVNGNDIECTNTNNYNLVKLIYSNGLDSNDPSYNTVISLNEDSKDVDNMLSKEIYNIKGKVSKINRATGIIKDLGEYESNEVERINVAQGKKIRIKGKITSVKKANDLLV